MEVATLTAISNSTTHGTQTDDEFLHIQEETNNDARRNSHHFERIRVRGIQIPSSPTYYSVFSNSASLNTSANSVAVSQISDYDSLPTISQFRDSSPGSSHLRRISSLRSSQPYSSIKQANLNRKARHSTIAQIGNYASTEPLWKMICSECGKRR